MNRRWLIVAAFGLVLLWVVVFIATNDLLNSDGADVEIVVPTQRPTREDVPELVAPTDTPSPEVDETSIATEEVAQAITPQQTPTEAPTQRPTPAFTLTSLEIARFQRDQQEDFMEEWLANAQTTLELPKDQGSYPIRLAIEDLGILAAVLVVQTDPNFDIVTPREEIGYYALSSKIGEGGNSVMVGHVYPGRVFNELLDAEVGQIIRITDEFYEEHYYRVDEIIRFPYEEGDEEDRRLGFEYIYDDSEERITLVTCYPEFEWTHRFVVRAVPISEAEAERLQSQRDAEEDNS